MPIRDPQRARAAPSSAAAESVSPFGTTSLDSVWPEPGAAARARRQSSTFDVCHVGVVLRTVVFVQGVIALGLLFTTQGWPSWLDSFSLSAGVSLPAVLLWLVLACAVRQPMAQASTARQWVIGGGLGAVAGGACWGLGQVFGLGLGLDGISVGHWSAPVLAGAALACGVTLWLQWREQARWPAEAAARLAELQSRIRPHFLFNTLNTALALIRLDPARAEGVLEDLSELFRVALTDTGASVSLEDEIDLARRYLAIEQVRFGDRLKLSWEIDAAAGAARVPPLLLQPLVENAVHHGVEPDSQGGTVRIRTRAHNGRVQISIVNTVPASPSRPGHGMALRNVKERLNLMHDVAGQFETRLHDGVFRVQISLPL